MNEAGTLDFAVKVKNPAGVEVDVTSYIDLMESQPEIVSVLNSEVDTFAVTLKNADALGLHTWQEIYFYSNTTGNRLFGGVIGTIDPHPATDLSKNSYDLGCSDFGALLERSVVQMQYAAMTDKALIAAVFGDALPGLSEIDVTTYVRMVATIPAQQYNRKTLREVLDAICDISGGYWYIDYYKRLHYFATQDSSAPWDVSDDPTEAGCQVVEELQSHRDGTNVVNIIELVGGKYLSDDLTDIYPGSGYKNTLNLTARTKPPTGQSKIVVQRNDGGATTNLETNPSFETNITTGNTQDQAGTGAAWAQDGSKYVQGSKSLKITAGTGIARVYGASITLAPGEALTVQCMAWCATAGKAKISILNASTLVTLVTTINRATSAWEWLTATYVNTSSASINVRRDLINMAIDSSTPVYFDAVQSEKQSWPSAYCDGSLGTGYAWTGTAHLSTSTRVAMAIWTTLTVKTGNNDTLSSRNEVLYFEKEGYLQQEAYWPNLSNAVQVSGKHETPLRVQVQNDSSYVFYGRWMKKVVTDTTIIDKSAGILRARIELAECAFDAVTIEYKTRTAGLRSGMMQHIRHAARGLDDDYLIQRVTTSVGIGGHVESKVELGASDLDLVKYLLLLKRKSKPDMEWDDTEVLDVILDGSDEIEVAEESHSVVDDGAPYLYDAARYSFARWS